MSSTRAVLVSIHLRGRRGGSASRLEGLDAQHARGSGRPSACERSHRAPGYTSSRGGPGPHEVSPALMVETVMNVVPLPTRPAAAAMLFCCACSNVTAADREAICSVSEAVALAMLTFAISRLGAGLPTAAA